jgi:3-hydroxyacyl-CoA dehydrogenase
LETKQEALDAGLAKIRKVYEGAVAKGKMKPEVAQQRAALLKPTLDYADMGTVDLVIEAVFEEIGVKQAVFSKLDEVCKPGAILASNTSTLDLNKIASFTKRPEDVVGAHFFSPANIMVLLEVIRGDKTSPDVLNTILKLGKKIKKTVVVSGVCDGFIGNRMVNMYSREAMAMIEEGATPEQIDKALEKFGMAMGPLKMGDMAGGDIGWAIRKRQYGENAMMRRAPIADKLCEMGRFGQKTGSGFYRYEAGKRDALVDPVVTQVIDEARVELGIKPRKISSEEIIQRTIFALVNEGAKLLQEGIAERASDIDMVYLTGYGFPVYRGGPMHYANQVGLMNVLRAIERFGSASPIEAAFWTPAPLLVELAAKGGQFK